MNSISKSDQLVRPALAQIKFSFAVVTASEPEKSNIEKEANYERNKKSCGGK